MLKVAKSLADLFGYITVDEPTPHDALKDSFWGNQALGLEALSKNSKVEVITCRYIIPTFEEEQGFGANRIPRISIDMYWGQPRLHVSLPDKTLACVTYRDGVFSEAQAFGPRGLELATSIKAQIDQLIKCK